MLAAAGEQAGLLLVGFYTHFASVSARPHPGTGSAPDAAPRQAFLIADELLEIGILPTDGEVSSDELLSGYRKLLDASGYSYTAYQGDEVQVYCDDACVKTDRALLHKWNLMLQCTV